VGCVALSVCIGEPAAATAWTAALRAPGAPVSAPVPHVTESSSLFLRLQRAGRRRQAADSASYPAGQRARGHDLCRLAGDDRRRGGQRWQAQVTAGWPVS